MPTKKPTRTTTALLTTTTETTRLTDEETRLLRMRRGLTVRDREPLGLKHTETDRARQALLAIEREMVVKMHARHREQSARKTKIVDSLRVGGRRPPQLTGSVGGRGRPPQLTGGAKKK